MKTNLILIVATAAALSTMPAIARDTLPQVTTQTYELRDGSTVYVFNDGKMAKEDRFGRAVPIASGEVLQLTDGRTIPAIGNEVGRLSVILSEHDRS